MVAPGKGRRGLERVTTAVMRLGSQMLASQLRLEAINGSTTIVAGEVATTRDGQCWFGQRLRQQAGRHNYNGAGKKAKEVAACGKEEVVTAWVRAAGSNSKIGVTVGKTTMAKARWCSTLSLLEVQGSYNDGW
ncbi:hypothetical protein BHE74_00036625 [Ensete ventricosum]|nr:hypothetical protein GW17_00055224 [Ensete ventricosum]RWW56638.1 hypothetical protein BHE74_00036625 [Ensete ventricosum]RZR98274.1 hypothetical protein BHM03_00027597 [Ensete ventricosum]